MTFNFGNGNSSYGYHTFIKQSDIFENNSFIQRPFIEDNHVVLGVYASVYEYNKSNIFYLVT